MRMSKNGYLVTNINIRMLMPIIIFCVSIDIVETTCLASAGGSACCAGYMQNKITGKCEKCPLGYYGFNCLKKCPSPSYGDDCQKICSCETQLERCHFAFGCVLTDDFQYTSPAISDSSTVETTMYHSSTGSVIVRKTFTSDVSTFQKETLTRDNLRNQTLLENSDITYIIISLVGLFVFFFGIFVVTYSYQKCFRRRSRSNLQDHDITNQPVQYKALHFGAEEQEFEIHSDQLRRLNSDPTYLSPVYHPHQDVEPHIVLGDISMSENLQNLQPLRENTLPHENQGEELGMVQENHQNNHVYVEIIEENDVDVIAQRYSPDGRDSNCYVNTET